MLSCAAFARWALSRSSVFRAAATPRQKVSTKSWSPSEKACGTGLSTLLRGLKVYTSNLTAIVTVADDGGSTGVLRQEFGVVAPGDLRQCIAALAEAEPLMSRLFQYRFTEGTGLEGHSFGKGAREIELPLHGALGDRSDLLLEPGIIGELVDAFLADDRGIHVGDEQPRLATFA